MFGITAKGALGGLQEFGSFIAASQKAASDRKWQAYNNKMTRLQDAQNNNALTANERMRKERKHAQVMQVQKSEYATLASAEVAAAASGTVGRSVNAVMFGVKKNAAAARKAIERDDELQDIQTDQNRLQSAMQTAMALDLRAIPRPNPASLLLGIGSSIIGNPED